MRSPLLTPLTLGIGLAGWLAGAGAWALQPQELIDPRPASQILDEPKLLPPDALQTLQRLCAEVRAQTGAELMVVIVGSIAGADPQGFASALFERFGIGGASQRAGALLFVSLEDHAVVGMLGSGIDSDERAKTGEEILQTEIIPRFRAGEPVLALLRGAEAYAQRVLGARPSAATPPPKGKPRPSPKKPHPRTKPSNKTG